MEENNIWERTQKARRLTNLTQVQMAEKLGIEGPAYSKYETRSAIKQHLIGKFCEVTGVREAWLISGEGSMRREDPEDTLTKHLKGLREGIQGTDMEEFISPLLQSIERAIKKD